MFALSFGSEDRKYYLLALAVVLIPYPKDTKFMPNYSDSLQRSQFFKPTSAWSKINKGKVKNLSDYG
jgi:hypothetical protein